MTEGEAGRVVKLVLGNYPTQRQRMSAADVEAMLVMWFAVLEDVGYEAARDAVVRIAKTSRWMPSPAEVRAAIGAATGPEAVGLEAWSAVRKAVGRYGAYRVPGVDFTFEDPITAQIVSPELWLEICASEMIAAERARFVEAYEQISRRERTVRQLAPGAGSLPALPRSSEPIPLGAHVTRLLDAAKTTTEG